MELGIPYELLYVPAVLAVLVVGFMLGHWLFGPLDHLLSFVIPSR